MKKRMLLRGGHVFDVERGSIGRADILIEDGIFASTDYRGRPERGCRVIECKGKYISPGLIDSHTHTELALMTIAPYSEMIMRHGTTAAIMDCHDFVNVVGMKGLHLLIKEARLTPLRTFFTVPPCVPSALGFEDSGAKVGLADIKRAMNKDEVVGMAEVMDVERVLSKEPELMKMIAFAKKTRKVIDGHCPSQTPERERRYFKLTGATTDHESSSPAEIFRKMRFLEYVHLRLTSLGEEYPYGKLFASKEYAKRFTLSSDGCLSPVEIASKGHISYFIRELVRQGVSPVAAVAAATINPARCYGLDKDIGSIKTGKKADLVIFPDLKGFAPIKTLIGGLDVTDRRAQRFFNFPAWSRKTVNIKPSSRIDLSFKTPKRFKKNPSAPVYVISLGRGLLTKKETAVLKNSEGEVKSDPKKDILKAVVMERVSGKGMPVVGFVKGFGLKSGAFGGSIGQDCQHIVAIGCCDKDIAAVIDMIRKRQGGIFFAQSGKVVSGVNLPIGGIMSSDRFEKTASSLDEMENDLRKNGVKLRSPYLALSLQITLAAIPELKLTNRGLLDVNRKVFLNTAAA